MTKPMRVVMMAIGCGLAAFAAQSAVADAPESVDELVEMLSSDDGAVRLEARNNAAEFGPEAVEPVTALFDHDDRNVYIAAKWSLRNMVHHSARPDADEADQAAMAEALAGLLDEDQPERVVHEALYLLGLCGTEDQVPAIAEWLNDSATVDAAAAALVRIPGDAGLEAMLDAVDGAEGDVAVSLIHAIAQEEGAAARDRLEALAESDDDTIAGAATKALSIRDLRVDYEG